MYEKRGAGLLLGGLENLGHYHTLGLRRADLLQQLRLQAQGFRPKSLRGFWCGPLRMDTRTQLHSRPRPSEPGKITKREGGA